MRFAKVASSVLNVGDNVVNMADVELDTAQRAKLIAALEAEFEHNVPNSMIHTMTNLDLVFHFFSAKIDVRTPYDKLHDAQSKGHLPPNLRVQLNPIRFGDDLDNKANPLASVTAFPRSRTVMVSPEARKKYKDVHIETYDSFYRNSHTDPVNWFD